jgi:hypothetical protein
VSGSRRSIVYAIVFIIALASLGYLAVGPPAVLMSAAFVGGLVLWLLTTYRAPVEPQAIIGPYLLTVILFIVHVAEEYVSHIERSLSAISGVAVSQSDFLAVAAFAAPIVWLAGAVMTLRGWPFGFFFASTFLFGMMFGELSHLAFPFLEDGTFHYSHGMLTAVLPIASAWYTFSLVRRERSKTTGGPTPAFASPAGSGAHP